MNRATHYHNMTTDELRAEYSSKKQELFNLRFQHSTGQLKDTLQLNKVRKDIARVLTVITEREMTLPRNTGKQTEVKKVVKKAKAEDGGAK